jgi:hypothetical protein
MSQATFVTIFRITGRFLSEHFSHKQLKAEKASRRGFQNRFSEFLSVFTESSRHFIFIFSIKRQAKMVKTITDHTENTN